MHKSRTPGSLVARAESGVEESYGKGMTDHATPESPVRRRVSTAEFVTALEREEIERRREELASKVILSSAEVRSLLRMSPQALTQAVKANRMYALRGPSDEPVYPSFFTKRSPGRAVLERVCVALGDLPGECKHFFLTSKRFSLGSMTPLQALARGNEDEVLAAAEAFREE
jgi:hypothetical protein